MESAYFIVMYVLTTITLMWALVRSLTWLHEQSKRNEKP